MLIMLTYIQLSVVMLHKTNVALAAELASQFGVSIAACRIISCTANIEL